MSIEQKIIGNFDLIEGTAAAYTARLGHISIYTRNWVLNPYEHILLQTDSRNESI